MADNELSIAEAVKSLTPVPEEPKSDGDEAEAQEAPQDPQPEEEESAVAAAETDEGSEELEPQESDETDLEEAEEELPVFTVKVNGEDREVTLEELTKGYSAGADYTGKTETLAAERRDFEAAREEAVEAFRQRFEELNKLIGTFDQDLSRYDQVDWEELWENDPEEAAKLESKQRREIAKRNKALQEGQQIAAQQQAEQRKAEHAKLIKRVPTWSDPKVYQEEGAALGVYLRDTYGVSDAELGSLIDHRHIDIARKAKLWDESQKAKPKRKEIVAKKVVNKPRVATPGAARSAKASELDAIADLQKRAKKSGTVDDAVAVLRAQRKIKAG